MPIFTSYIYYIILFTILITSCQSSQKGQSSASEENSQTENADKTNNINGQQAKGNILFSLEKTPCYGTCPVYKFVIYKNGTGFYNGMQYVDNEGKYKHNNLDDQKKAIINYANQIDYFQLASKYPEDKKAPSDFSQTITRLSIEQKNQKVVNKGMGAPEQLKQFEAFADSILKEVDWQEMD